MHGLYFSAAVLVLGVFCSHAFPAPVFVPPQAAPATSQEVRVRRWSHGAFPFLHVHPHFHDKKETWHRNVLCFSSEVLNVCPPRTRISAGTKQLSEYRWAQVGPRDKPVLTEGPQAAPQAPTACTEEMQVTFVLALVAVDLLRVCEAGGGLPFWFLRVEYHGGQQAPARRPGPQGAGGCVQEVGALAKEPPTGPPCGMGGPNVVSYSDWSEDVPSPDFLCEFSIVLSIGN